MATNNAGFGVDVRITGADNLAALAKQLKAIGDTELMKELRRTIRASTKPMIADARTNARDTLPKAGGLNETVAKSKFSTRIRTSVNTAGVRITATGRDFRLDRDGTLRHPVYGHKDRKWAEQHVTPGWFTKPMLDHADDVRAALVQAIDDVTRKIR